MPFQKKVYNVLMIDDDEGDYFLVNEYIKEVNGNYSLEWVSDFNEGLRRLKECKHDLYLIDHLLGAGTGIDLIKEGIKKGCKSPMILLTGMGNREVDVEALREGAADYFPKSQLTPDTLDRLLRHAIQRYENKLLYEQQQLMFKTLFEQSNDPIFIVTEEWKYKEVNNSFTNTFAISSDNFQNKNLSDIFERKDDFFDFQEHLHTNGSVQNYSVNLLASDGSIKIALLSSSPLYDSTREKITGFQGTVRDITQLKKAEREIMMAEQVSMTGRMARIMAHEVRNPLTNISLASDQLLDEIGTISNKEDSITFIDIIKRNTTRINKLISDLLNTTRNAKLIMSPCAIENVLEEVLRISKDRIVLKNIQLSTQGLGNKTIVEIDPERMKIAFTNIITNAIEAMETSETRQLDVSCSMIKDSCCIKISDTGTGMDEDTKRNLFEPFYTKRSGGMGLGMTAVNNIVTQHKGAITVESEEGKGTTFIIELLIN